MSTSDTRIDRELDLRGEVCPHTFVKSKLAIEPLESGHVLRVLFDHRPAVANVSRSMANEGHTVLEKGEVSPGLWQMVVRKA